MREVKYQGNMINNGDQTRMGGRVVSYPPFNSFVNALGIGFKLTEVKDPNVEDEASSEGNPFRLG